MQRILRPCRFTKPRINVQRTTYATQKLSPMKAFRDHPLPAVLIGFSFLCLGAGIYDHLHSEIQEYPTLVRQPLCKAIYYQNNSDAALAQKYFEIALEQARETPDLEKKIMISLLIQLGALQESTSNWTEARRLYTLALRHIVGREAVFEVDPSSLEPSEQTYAVALAQKLGDITSAMKMDTYAEKWYTWSVNHLIKKASQPLQESTVFDIKNMPLWLTGTDLKVAIEKLGTFYASREKSDLAIDLYMRALSLIGLESCQSTVLMNNLLEAYAKLGLYEDAKLWGQKGLDLAQNPNTRKIDQNGKLCETSCGVLLYNMGMLFETSDQSKAIQFYQSARKHGRDFKQADCIKESDKALRRIEFKIQRDNIQL